MTERGQEPDKFFCGCWTYVYWGISRFTVVALTTFLLVSWTVVSDDVTIQEGLPISEIREKISTPSLSQANLNVAVSVPNEFPDVDVAVNLGKQEQRGFGRPLCVILACLTACPDNVRCCTFISFSSLWIRYVYTIGRVNNHCSCCSSDWL